MPEYTGRFIPTKVYSGINAKKKKGGKARPNHYHPSSSSSSSLLVHFVGTETL